MTADANEKRPSVLVIDDEDVMQDVLLQLLTAEGFEVAVAPDGENGLERLGETCFDLVLLDMMLPGMPGLDVLERIRRTDPELAVIMITAYATVETAIEAMKRGASDYLVKPFRNDELLLIARRAIAASQMRAENQALRRELREKYGFDQIIGRSPAMQSVFELIRQAAPSRSTILIEGESGTGKELVARAVHHASPRADGPFVVVNCGNLPEELQESTLFGHVKGAFAGAAAARKGLFEEAEGGTVLLDEISSLDAGVQLKLLRVLAEREIERLGSNKTIKVDVRIVAATHSDLRAAVEVGSLREDLYYRLKVITIALPPLRDRDGDVPLLATQFMQTYATENDKKVRSFAPETLALLQRHDWPGNVRELENVIQKAVVLCRGETIGPELVEEDLQPARSATSIRPRVGDVPYKTLVDDFERQVIVDALSQCDGVQKRAAEILGLKPTTLNEKIKRLQIRYRAS